MSNYKDWIDAIDLKVDYFSAFMKAWIAFNAWYESGEISIPGRTDKTASNQGSQGHFPLKSGQVISRGVAKISPSIRTKPEPRQTRLRFFMN